jgi:thiol-disulfide isomerase/thioredoxin
MTAGVVLGATALAIAFRLDDHFTTALPGYTQSLQNKIEASSTAKRELGDLTGSGAAVAADMGPKAPEFTGIQEWINTRGGRPLTLKSLRGKVVLVDFWTYSCVNCLRTLPHVKAWDRAYRQDGLVIVGVHTPEFAFEHVPSNVEAAVRKLGVRYPVAIDNKFGTWNAYGNQYWPAKYLIDRTGHVRYTHFGEGEYDKTEEQIRRYLGEKAQPMTRVADRTPNHAMTPESYLGYGRLERYAGSPVRPDRFARYRFTGPLNPDDLAYDGSWRVTPEHIEAGPFARLRLNFAAEAIHLVLGGSGRVDVLVNGQTLRPVAVRGEPRLYTLARFPKLRAGLLELRFSPGIKAYAFTFG